MSSESNSTTKTSKIVVATFDHPRLTNTDASSILVFLRSYDLYAIEVKKRACQIVHEDVTTGAIKPVNIKFCVDAEWLVSTIALSFPTPVESIDQLTGSRLRAFLESKADESRGGVTLDKLDDIVSHELRINMRDSNATSKIQNLFVPYTTILRRSGLSWIVKDNRKVAVCHFLSAIRPSSLQSRLDSDVQFSNYDLRKNLQGFTQHAIKLSKAFQLVDSGKPSS